MADTNLITIQGTYQGALSSNGPALFGRNNSVDNSANIPVVVTGLGTSSQDDSPYSFVGGRSAKATASCSFVFNGVTKLDGNPQSSISYTENTPYVGANREGTASFNLNGGLDGMYIGDKSLKTHMENLSSFAFKQASSSDIDNNIVHRTGDEEIYGEKRFNDFARFGTNQDIIEISDKISFFSIENGPGAHESSNHIYTAAIELEDRELKLKSITSLRSTNNTFFDKNVSVSGSIAISENSLADFSSGTTKVKTANQDEYSVGDDTAASTKYVHDAIVNRMTGGGVYGDSGIYTGVNTFANNVTLSSFRTGTEPATSKVEVDLRNGKTYVADCNVGENTTLAANCKFVNSTADSYYSKMTGGQKSVGSNIKPIYLNGGSSLTASLVPSNATVGANNQHMYMLNGTFTAARGGIGNADSPVYLNQGLFTECNALVNVSKQQDINGIKTFTNSSWHKENLKIYSDSNKGAPNITERLSFIASGTKDSFAMSSMKVGEVLVEQGQSFGKTELRAYKNEYGSTDSIALGVRISNDGKLKQAYSVYPTDGDGNPYESTAIDSTVLPTVGWTNTHYARKDIYTEFSSSVRFLDAAQFNKSVKIKGAVEIYHQTSPYIDFHIGETPEESSKDYTARIIQAQEGTLRIIPCAPGNQSSINDTAASIFLGSQTIGATNKPIYLNKGVITPITENIGSNTKLMYMSNGNLKESNANIGSEGGSPTLISVVEGNLQKSSLTLGDSKSGVWLSSGKFIKTDTFLSVSETTNTQTVSGIVNFQKRLQAPGVNAVSNTKSPHIQLVCGDESSVENTLTISQSLDTGEVTIIPYVKNASTVDQNSAKYIKLGTKSLGNAKRPVYLQNGVITPISGTAGALNKLMYLSNGTFYDSNYSAGNIHRPIYIINGEFQSVAAPRILGHWACTGPYKGSIRLPFAVTPELVLDDDNYKTCSSARVTISNVSPSSNAVAGFNGTSYTVAKQSSVSFLFGYKDGLIQFNLPKASLACNITMLAWD